MRTHTHTHIPLGHHAKLEALLSLLVSYISLLRKQIEDRKGERIIQRDVQDVSFSPVKLMADEVTHINIKHSNTETRRRSEIQLGNIPVPVYV